MLDIIEYEGSYNKDIIISLAYDIYYVDSLPLIQSDALSSYHTYTKNAQVHVAAY